MRVKKQEKEKWLIFLSISLDTFLLLDIFCLCPDGGIGRHARLKIWCPWGCVGSSPTLGSANI